MAEKRRMVSALYLSLVAFAAPALADELPRECRNVAVYASTLGGFGVGNDHVKTCREEVAAIFTTFQAMSAANKKAVRKAQVSGGDSQVSALVDSAALAGAGADTEQGWSKNAAVSQTQFKAVADKVAAQIKRIDAETRRVLEVDQVSDSLKARFRNESAQARADLVALRSNAQSLADESGRYAAKFQADANGLGQARDQNEAVAMRLKGGQNEEGAAPAKQGVSKNLMIGLGGAALITAGAVGGLYWVSQKAISKANEDAAARISQAQFAANNVIANAGATATAVITAAQTAVQQILQFAINSANQVIANASDAANKIYDRAKTDVNGVLTQLRADISSTFQNLSDAGLAKLSSELQSMFSGLVARAKAEGKAELASSLQSTLDTLSGDIQTELQRRRGTGSAVGTSSGTSTSTGTSSGSSTGTFTSIRE